MTYRRVGVRELAAWGLDAYEFRPERFEQDRFITAANLASQRLLSNQPTVLRGLETAVLGEAFLNLSSRSDLVAEMIGLKWALGVVDLRTLIAFQRRLFFNADVPKITIPSPQDWPGLLSLCFGPPQPVQCDLIEETESKSLIMQSTNPNLHIRLTADAASPIRVHSGSPFFEVACLRDRWFLRDGYHRAYALLKAGVFEVPAVIVKAETLEELGAVEPWFFPEGVLFSATPPYVCDFLNDDLVLEYDRPPLVKTIRITMEEILAPLTLPGENT
jgi:hypothetical protein